ncbi:MAG: response regulator [Alkalispirochaetaceae bacterium]
MKIKELLQQMYRIVLIDDEQVVREGMAESIPWGEHGFHLVAACRDGRDGLEAIRRHQPQVVLTDICMPFVDGLEVASTVREELPATRTIFLTGYDDFQYAQEAVKLRAEDFLLKPITAEELSTLLDCLRQDLDREGESLCRAERLQEQLRASFPVFRERFLTRLIQGTMTSQELSRGVELLDLDLPGPFYIALVCDPDPAAGETEEPVRGLGLQSLLAELVDSRKGAIFFATPGGAAVIILSCDDPVSCEGVALELAEEISEGAEHSLPGTVSIGIGEPVGELPLLSVSCLQARTALERRLIRGTNQTLTIKEVRGGGAESAGPDTRPVRERYLRAIQAGLADEARHALLEVTGSLRHNSEDLQECYVVMHQLLSETISGLQATGLDYRKLPGIAPNPFEQFSRMKTLEEMEHWFLALIRDAGAHLDGRRKEHSTLKAQAAQEYIHRHYTDPDLTLQSVCRALSVSKSYLSPVFKSHTGMTILEYLTWTRIDEAKLLLRRREQRVYEIAEAVGFRDPHYFSVAFRKQTGMSPTEFREELSSVNR